MAERLPELRQQYQPDVVIANGENAAGGLGIDIRTAEEIFNAGVDLITTGNHVWNKKEIYGYLEQNQSRMIRPQNYPGGAPGRGWLIWESKAGRRLLVINILGRVFMPDLVDCPFRAVEQVVTGQHADFVLVDFHGEATSEKIAMGYFLAGRVSAVLGTHTHVQTADERILPGGTAYITDTGMCGPYEGIIGVNAEFIVKRFLTALPVRFDVAKGRRQLNGVLLRLEENGSASEIQRINVVDPETIGSPVS